MFAGTSVGPFRSTNGGANWTPLMNGFPGAFVFAPREWLESIAGTNGEGVWFSTNCA